MIHPRRSALPILILLAAVTGQIRSSAAEDKFGVRMYYRILGEQHNGPFPLKTKSILLIEGETRTRTTGMANSGFTEYPYMKRTVSYTFAEDFMYFPRIASGLDIDPVGNNSGDILVPQVYAPEASVWGPASSEFVQTFTATGRELVSATFLTPSAHGFYRAALVEGGPGGPQIGPSRSVQAGSLQWGWARWNPGSTPLKPGATYGIRIWREDGQPWTPFLHATGDAYGGGPLHAAEGPLPRSDMALWIVEEHDDLTRAILPQSDDQEWAYNTSEFLFIPRSKNIRLISLRASPVEVDCRVGVLTVWSTEEASRPLAGPKTCVTCSRPGSTYEVHYLFAQDELPVTPGTPYRAELRWLPFQHGTTPTGVGNLVPMDLQARVYGEPHPGALPAIANLKTHFPGGRRHEADLDHLLSRPHHGVLRTAQSPCENVRVSSRGPQ